MSETLRQKSVEEVASAIEQFSSAQFGPENTSLNRAFNRDEDQLHNSADIAFTHGDELGNLGVDKYVQRYGHAKQIDARDTREGNISNEVHYVGLRNTFKDIETGDAVLRAHESKIEHVGSTEGVITTYVSEKETTGDNEINADSDMLVTKVSDNVRNGEYQAKLTGERARRAREILLGRAANIITAHAVAIEDHSKAPS